MKLKSYWVPLYYLCIVLFFSGNTIIINTFEINFDYTLILTAITVVLVLKASKYHLLGMALTIAYTYWSAVRRFHSGWVVLILVAILAVLVLLINTASVKTHRIVWRERVGRFKRNRAYKYLSMCLSLVVVVGLLIYLWPNEINVLSEDYSQINSSTEGIDLFLYFNSNDIPLPKNVYSLTEQQYKALKSLLNSKPLIPIRQPELFDMKFCGYGKDLMSITYQIGKDRVAYYMQFGSNYIDVGRSVYIDGDENNGVHDYQMYFKPSGFDVDEIVNLIL
ncbi:MULTISPECIES: hypothetical protein [unclassified Fusibacter]|uniref:hypothetical protein n=1 Tax=unclassified Fusibacter TaxID=2624464 RepID=UPI0010138900|nr:MULTISPECIES: hypothetical protein [unclassified Fusibacter]MCK8060810.1 hypothetical protein [Fusibacter sp. A2]NPE23106.1 hypothetical protein [Fusibacter sp. A1]RXV59777.1 hypothetical protein DWB64_14835 [Fusibacter sp. A1]